MPPRYTTTAFEFAATSEMVAPAARRLDRPRPFDERNEVARAFLDRFEARHGDRPEYFFPPTATTSARMMLLAIAGGTPLTGEGVKDALEQIKMLPAASGAPGTRLRFGRFIRHGWVGSEFLVARRVLPDGSRSVLHGTIEGLLDAPGAAVTAEPVRVIQWATGAVGAAQLREVVDRPDLELVGLFVYDPAKVGVAAATCIARSLTRL